MNALAFWAIIEESWRESWARRTSLALAAIVFLLLLFFAFGISVRHVEGQPGMITLYIFGNRVPEIPISMFANIVEALAVSLLNPWGLFLGLFIATGLFSSMLARGRLYLLLARPIARWELYLARYLGGVLLVFVTTMLFCVGLWMLLLWKTGMTETGLIEAGLVVVFLFAVFYSFAALMALLSEGTGLALVATLIVWGLSHLAASRDLFRGLSPVFGKALDVLYDILPKTKDLEALMVKLIGLESTVSSWGFSMWSSALFAVVMLALGIYLFSRRDY